MSEEVLRRAVEPFFMTKEPGRGSGLGLSMVHGVTTQSGGGLHINSRLGRGTAVSVYLPRAGRLSAAVREREPQSLAIHEPAAEVIRSTKAISSVAAGRKRRRRIASRGAQAGV